MRYDIDRRTFIKGSAAGVGASALLPATGGAKPPSETLDDRLDTAGGAQEIIVVCRTNEDVTVLDQFDLPHGYHRFEVLPMGYTVATGEQIDALARRQVVRRITPNYELEYFNDDARTVTGAEAVAEDLGYDGKHGHAAVIDTGLDALHPDHQVNPVHNYQWVNPLDEETMWVDMGRVDSDGNGHGSHVSGTVAGDGSAKEEYRGMAPKADLTVYSTGAALLIVNSLGAYDHLIAHKQAGKTDVQVVNNSFGSISGYGNDFDPDDPSNVASYFAYQAGILPCWAAGNCGPDCSTTCGPCGDNTLSNTAQAPYVLGIAATDDDKNVTGFSSRGRTEDYDGIVNYDRDEALANYEEFRRSLQPPGDDAETELVYDVTGAGAVAGSSIDGIFGNPTQSDIADEFTLSATPGDETELEEVDGYFITTTLTWSPSSGAGVPEPSEFEYKLIGPDGTVATAGTNYIDRVRNEAALTIERYLPVPDDDAAYELLVEVSRGGGEYEVSGEVLAVDAEDGIPSPERPYSLERPSIGAPGNAIWSTMSPEDQLALTSADDGEPYYARISGTSMATPVVTGIVALLNDAYYREFDEYPDVLEVIDVLEGTAEFLDDAKNHTIHNIGKGFVDAEAAIEELLARGREEDDEETEFPPGPPQNPPEEPPDPRR